MEPHLEPGNCSLREQKTRNKVCPIAERFIPLKVPDTYQKLPFSHKGNQPVPTQAVHINKLEKKHPISPFLFLLFLILLFAWPAPKGKSKVETPVMVKDLTHLPLDFAIPARRLYCRHRCTDKSSTVFVACQNDLKLFTGKGLLLVDTCYF